jgi:L-threonylcarbamoyladenylate synthase
MDLLAAADSLRSGGVVIYPTETLYALGCAADNAEACARVAALKGRPEAKPFPLIVADMAGLRELLAPLPQALELDLSLLAARFWPGPLSVLLPTRPDLPALVRDAFGLSSVRLSPHPLASELCRCLGGAIVATSANASGQQATADPRQLDPALLSGAAGAILDQPWPAGGAPSTLVRLLGHRRVAVLRAGAVPVSALRDLFALAPTAETSGLDF